MFKVMDRNTQKICTVYAVDRPTLRDAYFLVYSDHGWDWAHSSYFVPVDEEQVELCISGDDGRVVEVMVSSLHPSCNMFDDMLDKAKQKLKTKEVRHGGA